MKTKKRWKKDDTELTLLALPSVVWFVLFLYLPMIGLLIAFKGYRVFAGHGFVYNLIHSDWVGLKNFEFLFKSNNITIFLRNTLGYNAIFIILGMVIPIAFAIMLSMLRNRFASKLYQTIMFFPHFLSWVVVAYFLFAFLSTEKGILNNIIAAFGGERVQWYSQAKYWPFILVFMQVWKTVGYSTVIYLASITAIDGSLYEAAVIDGATKWQQTKYITIPSLTSIAIIMFLLNVGRMFYSDFGLFYQLTQRIPGSLYNVASTLDTYVYAALQGNTPVGMTAAATFFQSVACAVTILIANGIVRKIDPESALI
ncbi:MAG: ABC transporter permease subunit [Clostridiales bacterium]|jgi:putative aldouronate transport system permease protein|nr:ABC transporter permease subunit [Clostridiales bacterium]